MTQLLETRPDLTAPLDPRCVFCDTRLEVVLDLGLQPLANNLLTSPEQRFDLYPLRLAACPGCSHVQLADSVPPDALFSEYVYRTGASAPMVSHFQALARKLREYLAPSPLYVVEVGSNDGTFLRAYRALGGVPLGVDPSSVAKGVEDTKSVWFNQRTAQKLLGENGPAGCVLMANVLAHAPRPQELLAGARDLLPLGGLLVIEAPYLQNTIDAADFSQVYAEHSHYLSATVLDQQLDAHGFGVEAVEWLPVHGGSLRVFARRAIRHSLTLRSPQWQKLLLNEAQNPPHWSRFRARVISEIQRLQEACAGRTVIGYGAPAKATVILSATGIKPLFCSDTTSDKQGKFIPTPQGGIPIWGPDQLDTVGEEAAIMLLSHNYASFVMEREERFAGRWVVPFRPSL